jgi:chromosomal replication initiator protein
MDAKQVWRAALGELQVSLSPANFETWLRDTVLVDVDDNRFKIAVPNGFAKDWLETRYRSLISQTLARIVGYSVQVEFMWFARGGVTPGGAAARRAGRAPAPVRSRSASSPPRRRARGRLHQHQPALHLRQLHRRLGQPPRPRRQPVGRGAPGHAYNPLFLYGGVGLGKTHLMHAIGNAVIARFPRKRVVYATSEKFTNEFITSIQQGKIDDFRARYRRIDLLLIDDIQFIADKERTQEEFFHTFNAIHEDGKQIVLSSDRPPKAILTLEERLRSRFEWGLIADLTAPDLETRIAILRAKAEEQAVPVSSDVLEFIARKVVSNIRELEGALNRIVAYASMGAVPITIELAQAVLSNVLYNPKKRQVTPGADHPRGVGLLRRPDRCPQGPEARQGDRRAAPDRDVPDARGDGRLAAAHRRRAGRPGPLHGPARLRQDQPRDGHQRRAAPRAGRRPELIYAELR